jgi:hypothetical protein
VKLARKLSTAKRLDRYSVPGGGILPNVVTAPIVVPGIIVGLAEAEDEGRDDAGADIRQHDQEEGAGAADRLDPAPRDAGRRKGERLAAREAGNADDDEGPEQEKEHEHDDRMAEPTHAPRSGPRRASATARSSRRS